MKRLAIFGAGGHGKVVASVAVASDWKSISFYDDASSVQVLEQWNIVGSFEQLLNDFHRYQGVIVALGDNQTRWLKHYLLREAGANLVTLIHPFSSIYEFSSIGAGSVIMPGAVINIGSKLGESCIVNTGAIIDHDCIIDDSVHIGPGAKLAGNVSVGARSLVGIGSAVRQGVCIGADVLLGAGTVVVKDVEHGSKMVGNPAKHATRRD